MNDTNNIDRHNCVFASDFCGFTNLIALPKFTSWDSFIFSLLFLFIFNWFEYNLTRLRLLHCGTPQFAHWCTHNLFVYVLEWWFIIANQIWMEWGFSPIPSSIPLCVMHLHPKPTPVCLVNSLVYYLSPIPNLGICWHFVCAPKLADTAGIEWHDWNLQFRIMLKFYHVIFCVCLNNLKLQLVPAAIATFCHLSQWCHFNDRVVCVLFYCRTSTSFQYIWSSCKPCYRLPLFNVQSESH